MKYLLSISSAIVILAAYFLMPKNDIQHRPYQFKQDGLVYYYDSDKLYTGEIVDTGNVIVEFEVSNGIKHGWFTAKYLDGQIEKKGFINQSKNEGEWKYFYPNGNLESLGSFDDDKPVGIWKSFYPNGSLYSKGYYLEGKQNGLWTEYDINGNIRNQTYYIDGRIVTIVKHT